MRHNNYPIHLFALACVSSISLNAQAGNNDPTNISSYLVDISATPVSAGGLVGLSGSAITNIQSAQDLTLAISPFSSGSGKSGFGLSITPARTSISFLAMPINSYVNNNWSRLLGAATLSYAENASTIAGASYRKSAFSLDTTYYIDPTDDPIVIGNTEFPLCTKSLQEDLLLPVTIRNIKNDNVLPLQEKEIAIEKAVAESEKISSDEWNKCLKEATSKAKWNASKLSLSAGAGWVKPDATAGSSQSLGRSLVVGGIFESGKDGATYISLQRTSGEVDLKTLAGTPTFSNSTLAAIRFTQGVGSDSTLRFLAEVSNAKDNTSATATVSNSVFKYAFGLDKKLANGIWAEFRFGRKRTEDGTTTQNAALLNLNWSPSSTLFSSK